MSTVIPSLQAKHFFKATAEKYFVLRTSALYGRHPCRAKGGRNFVELMLKLATERDELRVVDDEVVSPTSTRRVGQSKSLSSAGRITTVCIMPPRRKLQLVRICEKILEVKTYKTKLSIASSNEFPSKVHAPKYSVLENRALKALGLN